MMILGVDLEVLGELLYPAGEQRDLHLGGTGVALFATVLCDDLLLLKCYPLFSLLPLDK